MKTIKFRAWNKIQKLMFFPDALDLISESILSIDRDPFHVMLLDIWNKEGSFVLMQYTGLKDKNGKEIYEGDIVVKFKIDMNKLVKFPYISEVKWFEPNTGFIPFAGGCGEWESKTCEVIGNIYENPELLKKKVFMKGKI